MRTPAAILTLFWSHAATPEQVKLEWWQEGMFGAPCTTETDRREGTCQLEVKRRPDWRNK